MRSWLGQAVGRICDFSAQGIGNMAWACAKLGHLDEKLFAELASAAQLRMSEFNA